MKSPRRLSITAIFVSCAWVAAATVVAAHAVTIRLDRSARVNARAGSGPSARLSSPLLQRRPTTILAVLESVEGEKRQVSFRPTEISINRSIKWRQTDPTQDRLAYNAKEPALLEMEFTVTSATDVHADFIKTFKQLTQEDNDHQRPPLCRFTWGNTFPVFTGVIETLNVKYVSFAADGTPLSAVVKIQMKEALTLLNRSEAEKLKK
jgi:hypothetical protein